MNQMLRLPTDGPVLGLIPAKGGSSRLARKNLRLLGDKPLLAWAAEAARASGIVDRLIVSTEDKDVAEVAKAWHCDVPFLRPQALARDPAGVSETALHAIEELRARGEEYATIVILLPTCPFRTAKDIHEAYDMFLDRGRPFLMSVSEFDHSPLGALRQSRDGQLGPYMPQYFGRKSQDLPAAYRPNGAIHILDVKAFEKAGSYLSDPLVGYVMPRERSIDIDTQEDLRAAETLLKEADLIEPQPWATAWV